MQYRLSPSQRKFGGASALPPPPAPPCSRPCIGEAAPPSTKRLRHNELQRHASRTALSQKDERRTIQWQN